MHRVHRRSFRIHTYETDFRGRALPTSILNFLQEAAGEHAAMLGLSVTDLMKSGLTWVLSRYHLRLARYPAMGEAVEVRTWPSGRDGFFWLREFELCDGGPEPMLLATSSWVMLNAKTKQPVRDARGIPDERIRTERALADDFPRLPACESADQERSYRVGLHELDLNDHVNHAVYVRWALETTPRETLRTCQPLDIEIAYRGEAFFGDEILVRTQRFVDAGAEAPAGTFVHGVFDRETGRELTRLRTRWAPLGATATVP